LLSGAEKDLHAELKVANNKVSISLSLP
jgi:hypothetical protein